MSIVRVASVSSVFSSSSVKRTYWSLANSYPLTREVLSNTSLQAGQICCCLIRPPHFSWSRLNESPMDEAAVYILTGIETSPNESVPDPMECGGILCPPWGTAGEANTMLCYTQPRLQYRNSQARALAPRSPSKD